MHREKREPERVTAGEAFAYWVGVGIAIWGLQALTQGKTLTGLLMLVVALLARIDVRLERAERVAKEARRGTE